MKTANLALILVGLFAIMVLAAGCSDANLNSESQATLQDVEPGKNTGNEEANVDMAETDSPLEMGGEGEQRIVTSSELSSHSTEDSCWVEFEGNVYDVTSWLPIHPGGSKAISRFCGTTGFEDAFNSKHGAKMVGRLLEVTSFVGKFG